MMMMSLMILLMSVIGCCEQEENTWNLLYIIPPLQQNQEILPIKNLLVSEKVLKGKKLHTLHSKMKDTSIALAGVYTSLLNDMSVKMYLILSTHHPILKKNYLR